MNKHLIPIASLENASGFVEIARFLRMAGCATSDVIQELRRNIILSAMSSQACTEWESVSFMLARCRVMGHQRGGYTVYFFCRKADGVVLVYPLVDVPETGMAQKAYRSTRSNATRLFYYLKGLRNNLDVVKQYGMVIKLSPIYRDGSNKGLHEN